MRYLIGRELYLFDLLKKKQVRNAARGRSRKSKEEISTMKGINDMSEGQLLLAYVLSYPAMVMSDYNIHNTLRRVTLLQQRVEKDIDLYEFYKKLHLMRDILNKQYPYAKEISSIYCKHLYNDKPSEETLEGQPRLLNFAKKHNWSLFEQFAVWDATNAGVNLKTVFDNAFLEK
jgi:hypothetical protein